MINHKVIHNILNEDLQALREMQIDESGQGIEISNKHLAFLRQLYMIEHLFGNQEGLINGGETRHQGIYKMKKA